VPDPRLDAIAAIVKPQKVIPTFLEFVDIAGLVRGASKGEGLGNQFLANIREVDAIVHVLRCFEGEVTHVEGSVDPLRDAETVETELMLADMESLERQIVAAVKRARGGEKEAKERLAVMEPALAALQAGKPASSVVLSFEQQAILKQLNLLTAKPVLYVANVEEQNAAEGNDYSARVAEMAKAKGAASVVISAAIEAEVAVLEELEEKQAFLAEMGLGETGLSRVIRAGYGLLGLLTFFTAGPKEVRAWTVRKGAKAPEAAGVIHSDFERGFIRAETIAYEDFIACNGEAGAREAGKLRMEGKDYLVKDGDIFHFRFNV
jgi:GTP-binding protein YchF